MWSAPLFSPIELQPRSTGHESLRLVSDRPFPRGFAMVLLATTCASVVAVWSLLCFGRAARLRRADRSRREAERIERQFRAGVRAMEWEAALRRVC